MKLSLYGHRSRRLVDMTGERIGRVAVIGRAPNQNHGNAAWRCRCDCGDELIVEGIRLRAARKSGDTRFCCKACRRALRTEARAAG